MVALPAMLHWLYRLIRAQWKSMEGMKPHTAIQFLSTWQVSKTKKLVFQRERMPPEVPIEGLEYQLISSSGQMDFMDLGWKDSIFVSWMKMKEGLWVLVSFLTWDLLILAPKPLLFHESMIIDELMECEIRSWLGQWGIPVSLLPLGYCWY